MKKIQIYDTTLRDGEQAPGAAMTPEQKLSIAIELEELGVQVIEAGFPAASKNDLFAVSEISKICQKTTIAAFARTTTEDIQAAAYSLEKAKNPRITLVMPSSEQWGLNFLVSWNDARTIYCMFLLSLAL
jgi:2-isopropylmalate synthase